MLAGAAPGAAGAVGAPVSCLGCHAPHRQADGACVACHRGNPGIDRKALAHHRLLRGAAAAWGIPGAAAVEDGARLRDAGGCRRCHVTGGKGNDLAISLDEVAWARDQDELRASILRPASAMPDFGFTQAQADRLIAVLLRDARSRPAAARYQIRFQRGASPGRHPFERHCGPCHRALTRGGPMGVSASGPDLSGLLTPHYPVAGGRTWDRARLERWLRNPRAERPQTIMPPVSVTEAELDAIVDRLRPDPRRGDAGAADRFR